MSRIDGPSFGLQGEWKESDRGYYADTEANYKSIDGTMRGDPGAKCIVTTCGNGKKYETWMPRGRVIHAVKEDAMEDTPEFRAKVFAEAEDYEKVRLSNEWPDWLSFIPKEDRADACKSERELLRMALIHVPLQHPRRKHVEEKATEKLLDSTNALYCNNPKKVAQAHALWKRVKARTPEFCDRGVCERVGLRVLAEFMKRNVKAIKALLGKNTQAFDLQLGGMVVLVLAEEGPSIDVETPKDKELKAALVQHEEVINTLTAAREKARGALTASTPVDPPAVASVANDESLAAECAAAARKFDEQRAASAQPAPPKEQICVAMKHERDHGERLPPPAHPWLKLSALTGTFSDELRVVREEQVSESTPPRRPTFPDDPDYDKRYAEAYEAAGARLRVARNKEFKENVAVMRKRIKEVDDKNASNPSEEQVPVIADEAANQAMEAAAKAVGYKPTPEMVEVLKKDAVSSCEALMRQVVREAESNASWPSGEEAPAPPPVPRPPPPPMPPPKSMLAGTWSKAGGVAEAEVADAPKDTGETPGDGGDMASIARLRSRLAPRYFVPVPPTLTHASGSRAVIRRLATALDSLSAAGAGGGSLRGIRDTEKKLSEYGPWQVCLDLDSLLMTEGVASVRGGIQYQRRLIGCLMLVMHERLGVHAHPFSSFFKDTFTVIKSDDAALASLSGHTPLEKLNTWVNAVFEVTPVEKDLARSWGKSDVLYTVAFLLWTRTDCYSDLTSLMRWLETSDAEDIALLLLCKSFRRKASVGACNLAMHVAESMKGWCVSLKKHVVRDISTISTVIERLQGPNSATPAEVAQVAALAAGKAKEKLEAVKGAFAADVNESSQEKPLLVNSSPVVVKSAPEPEPEHPLFLPPGPGQACHVYPMRSWAKEVEASYEYFMQYRSVSQRTAEVKSLADWPMPLPYELRATEPFLVRVATCNPGNLSHKRTFAAQLLMIELSGALGWLDQQFHPLASWTQHVHQITNRAVYLTRHQVPPRTSSRSYRTATRQLRSCTDAATANEPEAFRRYMGIFNEKAFAEELQSQNNRDTGCLSTMLGALLTRLRDGVIGDRGYRFHWLPGYKWDTVPLPEGTAAQVAESNALVQEYWPKLWLWMIVINELTCKLDHVAVLVADALCIGISSLFPKSGTHSLNFKRFGDMVFHTGFKCTVRAATFYKFTDATAPIYYCAHWRAYKTGVHLSIEAASRIACSFMARARFPDTLVTEMIDHAKVMYELFVRALKVDISVNGYCESTVEGKCLVVQEAEAVPQYQETTPPRDKLKESLEYSHFGNWNRNHKLLAACAMIKFAQDKRQPIHEHQMMQLKGAIPATHATGVYARRDEIYANLNMARMLIDLVLHEYHVAQESGGLYGDHALHFGLEVDAVKKAWGAEDDKFDHRVATAEKEKRKREAREAREREKAAAAVVSRCVAAACAGVRLRAREADQQAELDEAKETLRQMQEAQARAERRIAAYKCIARLLSWAPRFVKRKAARVQRQMNEQARKAREAVEALARDEARVHGLAIAIERNRAVVKRRERHLAARAKVEQRALAQERKEAAKARTQAYKVEQADRQARIQAEVDAVDRARREREAKEAEAEAARVARLEARKAREEEEAARVAEEQRLCDADAKLAAELQEKEKAAVREATRAAREAAEHAAKVATEAAAERARRTEQSRTNRLVSQHVKELARDRFAKAFKRWRTRVTATHTARSVRGTRDALLESRRAAQERCNAIFREGVKEVEETKAANKAKALHEHHEARLRADKAAQAALAAEMAKADAAAEKAKRTSLAAKAAVTKVVVVPSNVDVDADAVAAAPPSSSPSSPETVTTCSPGPASPETIPAAPAAAAAEARSARAMQPPLPKEPAPPHKYNFNEADVQRKGERRCDGGAQWDADYREALAMAQMTSQNEWMNETGWATNRTAWFNMGGHALVMQQQLAQQQSNQHTATFHANCKHMARIRTEAHTALRKRLAERWNAQLNKEAELASALEYEELRLRELEAEIGEMEKTKEERRTRYAVLLEYLDGLEAATEEERRELSAKRCEQIRNRTSTYDACLGVNECVFCFEKLCDQIATPCNHVIGCEACVVKHRNAKGPECPICREPATFETMHLP